MGWQGTGERRFQAVIIPLSERQSQTELRWEICTLVLETQDVGAGISGRGEFERDLSRLETYVVVFLVPGSAWNALPGALRPAQRSQSSGANQLRRRAGERRR